MGNAKTKEVAWYVKPNPCLLRKNEFAPYLVGNEKEVPEDSVLQERAYAMIINEPSHVGHRLMYVIMAMRLKGSEKIGTELLKELTKYVDDAMACDPKESKCYSLKGFLYERAKKTDLAKEVYLAGYNNVYSVGGRSLSIHDVELLALFAAFCEEHGTPMPLPAGDVWKDCCLRAPESAIANGNYGLYLLRKGDGAGMARLQKAKELEQDPEGFWAGQLELHSSGGGAKGGKKKK